MLTQLETKIFFECIDASNIILCMGVQITIEKTIYWKRTKFFFYHMDMIRKLNLYLKNEMTKVNLDLCRYWNGERRRGW
jgi:hypothetical protein